MPGRSFCDLVALLGDTERASRDVSLSKVNVKPSLEEAMRKKRRRKKEKTARRRKEQADIHFPHSNFKGASKAPVYIP